MTLTLTIFAAFYFLWMALIVFLDIKDKEPLWDTLADALLLPAGFVGIVLYILGAADPELRLLWKVLAPVIVLGQVVNNLVGRKRAMKAGELDRRAVWFADILTAVILVPMFVLNILYAYRD